MIDSWDSLELISLSFEFKLWKTLLLILLFEFNHFQSRPHHFVSKLVQKNMQLRFFFVFFRMFHLFQFQVTFHLSRKAFLWIFVFRHFKHFQKCRFFKNNLEFRLSQFKNSEFQNNIKFRSLRFRPKNLEKVQQFNSSMFSPWSFSILTAFVQRIPWGRMPSENRT